MLQEPAFEYPLTQGKSCVCLEDGHYRAYLDRNAALEFLFSLHWFAQGQPIGEEIDIYSRNCSEMRCKGKQIGFVEFNMVYAHKHKKHGKTILKQAKDLRQKLHGKYTPECDRLDFFVSAEEARAAYETLADFLANENDRRRVHEITLFDTLIVRLVT